MRGDANVTYEAVAKVALETWRATDGTKPATEGPAYGFTQERRGSQLVPLSGSWMVEPRAEAQ